MRKVKRAVFFDRDGIIVKPVNGEAPTKVSDLELISETIPVIFRLQKMGYKIIVVSNQPDVALGVIDEKTKRGLVKKFEKLLKEARVKVDTIYYCFHHTKGVIKKYTRNCSCHKPKPGMLLKAKRAFDLDMGISFIVGDRASDIVAGKKAGVRTILLDPKNAQKDYLTLHNIKPDYTINSIKETLKII